MSFLALGTSLCVILAHVLVISSTESDDRLLSFVTHVDTNKHGFLRDFWSKVQSPQVTTQFCVDLTKNVDVDSIVVFLNGLR